MWHDGVANGVMVPAAWSPSGGITMNLFFLEDLYCLSRITLNSLVFTITWQSVDRKPQPTLLPTQSILSLPPHIDTVWEQLALDDAVSYTQRWKSKLAEVMGWGIEPPTFRLGFQLQKNIRHPNHSATEDAISCDECALSQFRTRPNMVINVARM